MEVHTDEGSEDRDSAMREMGWKEEDVHHLKCRPRISAQLNCCLQDASRQRARARITVTFVRNEE